MINLQSTSVQFGGFVVSTDDPSIIDRVFHLLDTWQVIATELVLLIWIIKSAAGSLDTLCRRLLGWLDWVEFLLTTPAKAVRRMAWIAVPAGYGPG